MRSGLVMMVRCRFWWDRSVDTTQNMGHIRPDVVVVDRRNKEWIIVDFSVPLDRNVESKEDEKISNYSPLGKEIIKMQRVSSMIVPVVVGSLGVVSKRLPGYLKDLQVLYYAMCVNCCSIQSFMIFQPLDVRPSL